jgi:hypothetical protein
MGVLAFVSGIFVWFTVSGLDANEEALNHIAEGHMEDPNKK